MRIWSILLTKSDLKWCIHLSRRLLFIFQANEIYDGTSWPDLSVTPVENIQLKPPKFDRNIKRDFYLDVHVYTILNSDLINNIDHMRISGTEPSQVILSKTK